MSTPDLEIEKAIANRYNDNSSESNALKAAITDFSSYETSTADDDYVTFRFINGTPDRTFTTIIENCLFQFDILSLGLLTCKQIAGLVMTVFDDYQLNLSEYSCIWLRRTNNRHLGKQELTNLHHYYIEYRIMVDK